MATATAGTPAPPADRPAKKVPCWVCGNDLTFNFALVADGRVAIHAYCQRCRKERTISMTVD